MNLSKGLLSWASLALVLLPAAACSSGQKANASGVEKVVAGVIGSIGGACHFIAQDEGFFKAEGLDVEFQTFNSGGEVVPLLARGQLDVGSITFNPGLVNSLSAGAGVRIVADQGTQAPGRGYVALLVRQQLIDSGQVSKLSDLKGKKVGVSSTAGVPWLVELGKGLEAANLTLKDVQLVQINFTDMNAALKNGSIDAAMQAEPNVAGAVKSKVASRLAGGDDFYPNHAGAVIGYGPDFMKNRPKAAIAYMKAYLKGCRVYNEAFEGEYPHKGDPNTRARVIKILTAHTSVTDAARYEEMRMPGLSAEGKVASEYFESDQKWYVANGLLNKVVEVDKLLDPSWAQKAVAAK